MIKIFKNAFLIDCTGNEPAGSAWVAAEGKFIKEIGFGISPSISGAEIIDCKGKTLLPGLIDAHIHVCLFDNDLGEIHRRNFPAMLYVKSLEVLKDTLFQGFTSARDVGGADAGFRVAVESGMVQGPKLLVSGKSLTMTGGHADMRLATEKCPPDSGALAVSVIADGVPEVQKAAREQLRQGVDLLKIMAGGGCGSPADEPDTSQYSMEEIIAVVKEAKAAKKEAASHNYSNSSMKICAEAGIYSIEHGNYLDKETAKFLKEKDCWLVPTLATYFYMSEHGEELGIPSYFLRKMKMVRECAMEAVSNAMEAGIKIGSGSDMVGSGQPFKAMELELKAKVMGPMKALLASTRENAKLMKMENQIGTVEPGKIADLILVEGNPLNDMSIFQDRSNLKIILQNGNFVKNTL